MSNESRPFTVHGPGCDQSLLLVLSAPSGTGKTTLGRRLVEETPNSVFSISCTTRPPRGAERDGVDYYFMSDQRFREMLHEDRFVEWAEVYGNFYGTPRSTIEDASKLGQLALFDIDVQGGEQIKARYPTAVTVLILPPSYEVLSHRLKARRTESDVAVEHRLLTAQSEIRRARGYDYTIVNDDVERALADLKAIVRAERARSQRLDILALGF